MHWIVDYENSEGELSTRELDEIGPSSFGPGHFDASCRTRGERRSFRIDRVLKAIDADTGEIIADIRPLLGLPPRPPPATLPTRSPPPAQVVVAGDHRRNSTEAYAGQRNRERRALSAYYVHEPIWDHFRTKLFSQFDDRCANCGAPEPLFMDHHWPMVLGGHLAPGNIVPLCRRCNESKRDSPPDGFYGPEALERIDAMLAEQKRLLAFEFNRGRWYASREARKRYLQEIGLSAELIDGTRGS